MDSQPIHKSKKPLVLAVILVGLLVLGTASYLLLSNFNKSNSSSKTQSKSDLVAPKEVQQDLISANDSAKKEYEIHNKAAEALDEGVVRLAR